MSIGVTKDEFFDSTPYDLEPYVESFKMRQRIVDQNAWQHNMYTYSAVTTAIDRALNGKKARSKYFEKPMSETAIENNEDLITEDEITKQRKQLLAKLQIMQANFELNHGNDDEGK